MEWTIYLATFPNGKVYVGQTRRPLCLRKANHRCRGKNPKTAFHFAIRKYGFESIIWTILERCSSAYETEEIERKWIQKFNSYNRDKGYNETLGGESCFLMTEEAKQKMKWSDEKKERLRPSIRERANKPENKQRLSETNKIIWTKEKRKEHSKVIPNKLSVMDNLGNKFDSLTDLAIFYGIKTGCVSGIFHLKTIFNKKYALRIWKIDDIPKMMVILEVYGKLYINAVSAAKEAGVSDKQILNIANKKTSKSKIEARWIKVVGVTSDENIRILILNSLRGLTWLST